MFEEDSRYTAVERPGDRKDLFDAYLRELQKKVLTFSSRSINFFIAMLINI